MVIQAGAGQQLVAGDPALATEAFDVIAEAVWQAEAEIGYLVELLDHEREPHGIDGIGLINEPVARAGAAGLAVRCQISRPLDAVAEQASQTVYRAIRRASPTHSSTRREAWSMS